MSGSGQITPNDQPSTADAPPAGVSRPWLPCAQQRPGKSCCAQPQLPITLKWGGPTCVSECSERLHHNCGGAMAYAQMRMPTACSSLDADTGASAAARLVSNSGLLSNIDTA